MKYIKQLDSIRAIAVILVIISHWIPSYALINITPNGQIGVDLFFVLSGFLITRILMESRRKAEISGVNKTTILKNFYFRRTLRIFPIYYLVIFLLLVFHESTGTGIKSAFIYFATYTSNFYFYKSQLWDGMLSHLWSLAVEEQFYLFWPWIILFTNKKYLVHVIIFFIIAGLASQYIFSANRMGNLLTITCFDAFGLGALLSWITVIKPAYLKKFYTALCFFAIASFVLFFLGVKKAVWPWIPLRTLVSIMAVWIITYVIHRGENNQLKFKFIFNNKILIFIGKISYGVYLYHNILPNYTWKFLNGFNQHLPSFLTNKFLAYLVFAENFILIILVSWLSWIIIEQPFLRLKKYFRYEKSFVLL